MTVGAHLRIPPGHETLRDALAAVIGPGDPEDGLVFAADPNLGDGWDPVRNELTEAFELTRRAAAAGAPVVYLVNGDDLLGRRGAEAAMVATGLLSGARSAALELRDVGIGVNVLAIDAESPCGQVAAWVLRLLTSGPGAPMGELIRLGSDHLGRALP